MKTKISDMILIGCEIAPVQCYNIFFHKHDEHPWEACAIGAIMLADPKRNPYTTYKEELSKFREEYGLSVDIANDAACDEGDWDTENGISREDIAGMFKTIGL